jgi:hypothetical protein
MRRRTKMKTRRRRRRRRRRGRRMTRDLWLAPRRVRGVRPE